MAQNINFLERNNTDDYLHIEISLNLAKTPDFVSDKNNKIVNETTTEEPNETDNETESEPSETDDERESEEPNEPNEIDSEMESESETETETQTRNQNDDSLCFTNFFNQLRIEEQFVASLLKKQQNNTQKPNLPTIPQVWNSILNDDEDIKHRVIYSEPEPIVKDCQQDMTMRHGFEKSRFSVDSFTSDDDEEIDESDYYSEFKTEDAEKEKDYVTDTIYYVDKLLNDYYDSDEESETSTLFNEEPMISRQSSFSAVVMTLVDKI
ncbi:9311_t:CDS:1 [Ambispora leptoticha]|uniref:9311_t:CDS:1 n=1 Tax=Ambispora leptoticha TaxID=144679 RepID=A0A9N9GEB9_9GLOM|nr:9311_t:CDS:1 [Ambispora leptoticha]